MTKLPHFTLINFPIEVFTAIIVENELGHSCFSRNDEDIAAHGFESTDALSKNSLVYDFVICDEFALFYHNDLILDFAGVESVAFCLIAVLHFVVGFDNCFKLTRFLGVLVYTLSRKCVVSLVYAKVVE